jgi:predicted aconitase
MEILVTLGDVFGAEGMGEVSSTHISGISYKNIGDPGLEFLEEWAEGGAVSRTHTTINPCGMDTKRWEEFGIEKPFADKQLRIVEAFKRMGATDSLSCTPYLIGNRPTAGQHIAWAESSAIAFANSVLGARTNREGGPTALASAITGRTPLFGYHLSGRRDPTHEVRVSARIESELEYSVLGYFIGERLGQNVPLFKGLTSPSLEGLKALSAGIASSGSVALYHIDKVTPEAGAFSRGRFERVGVDESDITKTVEKLSTGDEYDHVCIGCPHCSLRELAEIAKRVAGKVLKRELWIFTSDVVRQEAERRGYLSAIEEAGGEVICDTCMVVAPMRVMGVQGIITNSCKAAHYTPTNNEMPVTLRNLDECLEVALK